MRRLAAAAIVTACAGAAVLHGQRPAFAPVTEQMLQNPSPDDWLMYSRTYDAQRFSPLSQITRQNVGQLREVAKVELGKGVQESIPLVYRGVLYVIMPGAAVRALDASTGAQIWEHTRPSGATRAKTLAIYDDMVFYTVAGRLRRRARRADGRCSLGDQDDRPPTSGTIVVDGKVITGRACSPVGADCYISAHDARTGKEVWRFHTAAR